MKKKRTIRKRRMGRAARLVLFVGFCGTRALSDDIHLTAQKGPGAGQVTLDWSGGAPLYDVFRYGSPMGVVDPSHLLVTVPDTNWTDTPPDAPLLCYLVEHSGAAFCGNGVRDAGEQCDDGNLVNLDGCDASCRFEQLQRAIWFKMQFTTDAVCIRNQLGGAVVNGTAQSQLQSSIDAGIADGSTSILLTALGISDLTGTSEPPFQLGFVSGTPETRGGTLPYNGTNDLDWWYVIDPTTVDGAREPLSTLSAVVASHVLSAGPGPVMAPVLPGGPPMRMTSTVLTVTTGAASTPLVSASGDPPGHLPAENLDPALVSYATCGTATAAGSGRICGDVVTASLAQMPINPGFVTTCSEGYTASNSMLDAFVGGCTFLFLQLIRPTQPDRFDPDAPPAGAGAPYALAASPMAHQVTTCRDKNGAIVDLATCLNAAAYSSFFKFATDRVIPR